MVAMMREEDAALRLDGLGSNGIHVVIKSSTTGFAVGYSERRYSENASSNSRGRL
jgi:hypothetical protein